MEHVATLKRGERDGFGELIDILTSPTNNKIHISFTDGDSNNGVLFGFRYDENAYYEILDFEPPEGRFIELEVYRREWVHEDLTARQTHIIVTDKGRYPLCIFQHQSNDLAGTSRWNRSPNRDWESIL